jgi:hypothetical protein
MQGLCLMKCACAQLALCVDSVDAESQAFTTFRNYSSIEFVCSQLGNSGFISLQVLDMVLEDLKKEHPDAISVV